MQTPEDVSVDVIVVPGLAFDVHGARCGQGMGFYDRFLTNYAMPGREMPRLVSLALSVQIVDSVPLSEDDYKIDQVILYSPGQELVGAWKASTTASST